MILWLILLIVVLLIFIGGLLFLRWRDWRYRKKPLVETIGDELWQEMSEERKAELEKGRSFRKILKEKEKTPVPRG